MSGIEQALLAAVIVWNLALSFIVLLQTRQISLLTVRLTMLSPFESADDDGLDVGSSVPAELSEMLGRLVANGDGTPHTLVFLSGVCGTCRNVAAQLAEDDLDSNSVAFIGGPPDKGAEVQALLPKSTRVVGEPEASTALGAIGLDSVPFAVVIRDDVVAAKSFLHSAGDLRRLRSQVGERFVDRLLVRAGGSGQG